MEKKMYVAPELEVLEVMIEKGYRNSDNTFGELPDGGL